MGERVAMAVVVIAAGYFTVGFLVALAMVFRGVDRWDAQARGGTWGFRLFILPGAVALWPVLVKRWLSGTGPPEERNPHRDLAVRGRQP